MVGPLRAQDERIAFRHLTIADGLSQNAVQAILQDRRGFMWFGTKDGLNRYDGYQFVIFRHDPFDSTTLTDSDITALFEDQSGVLWVGTRVGGLNRLDRKTERFRSYHSGPKGEVTAIAEDDRGIWVATAEEGVFRIQVAANGEEAIQRFVHDPADSTSLSSDRVTTLRIDHRGDVWIGTEKALDRLVRSEESRFRHYLPNPTAPNGFHDPEIFSLFEDTQRRLWIGSSAGLSQFDSTRVRLRHFNHRYWQTPGNYSRSIQEDENGRIWIAASTMLLRFDPGTETFAYFPDRSDAQAINSDLPTVLYRDRSEVLWVGTNGYGLQVHDPKANRFGIFRLPGKQAGQSGFSVYTLFEDSSGAVWINAQVLYRWERRTGAVRSFKTGPTRHDDFGNTTIWGMVEDPSGVLWAGGDRGLFRYQVATDRVRLYRFDEHDSRGLPEPVVYGLLRDRGGNIWIATENYLARLVDTATGRFQSWPTKESPTHGSWTFPSLFQDEDGFIWIGSNQGLIRFNPGDSSMRHYRTDPSRPTSLSHDAIRAILPDPREPRRFLWIGTAGGGLNRLDLKDETFEHFTDRDGLPNNVVYAIQPDSAGRLWLSTNNGLSRFDPATREVRNFDENDGLQSNEFNSGSSFRSRSGELFFGGIYGFNYFRPENIRDNPHIPEIVITGFRRSNRLETVRDSGTVLRSTISETDTLRLSYRDDVISLEFAALEYSAPAKNRYAYRLIGFNDEWIESGAARSATYTDLPPGRYTFQVRGSNNDGVWNEGGTSLAIVVTPPWWRTWWAYALYGLLAISLLYAAREYEVNRIRLKNRLEIERVESNQLREIDQARSRLFANVSHEFRTPLTLTLGPLDDLRSGLHGPLTPAMADQVDLARRNAGRVLELINEILELARLEAGRTALRARRLDLGAFVAGVARTFVPLAERKGIAFEVVPVTEHIELYADPNHLEKVLSNLLSNAFKFTPAKGTVRLTVSADGASARIAVRDSGPGIPAAELTRIFDRFHRVESTAGTQPGTGIGLALAKELVGLHRGTLTVESDNGFGSTFIVTLPLGSTHLTGEQIVPGGEIVTAPLQEREAQSLPAPEGAIVGPDAASAEPGDDVTTVLVVEDNVEVRTYVKQHLAPLYRVLEAADGEQGLELAQRLLPDLVLSDVMMPGMDGYALCRAIKTSPETDFIPVILLTARAETSDRLTGLREQADDYLTKPFDVPELLTRIENLIAIRRRLLDRVQESVPPGRLHPTSVVVESADEKFLEQVRVAIEANLGDETFNVERLAQEVTHSRGHLHRRLRDLAGETPSDLIRRIRLERAAQLLEAGAGTVAEVAYSVGFKSVAHFSNAFRDRYGVRPSGWRERAR
jgi:signal transduction histidine kinase/ligand-binding sensor domain-containing protein/DNA-binding response OmpR family regulator